MTTLLLPAVCPVNVRALRSLAVACELRRKRLPVVTLDADMLKHVRAALYFEMRAA